MLVDVDRDGRRDLVMTENEIRAGKIAWLRNADGKGTTWEVNEQAWTPNNYDGEYEGPITLRRALALSRNIATIKVAEAAGYEEVAGLWKRVGVGTTPRPYPSIALGVFEATPLGIVATWCGATIVNLIPSSASTSSVSRSTAVSGSHIPSGSRPNRRRKSVIPQRTSVRLSRRVASGRIVW